MKKIVAIVFLSGILLVVSSIYVVSHLNYIEAKKDNMIVSSKILSTDNNNELEKDNSVTLNEDLTKLEESLKKEINEYNIWIKIKEKLTSITSS